MVYYGNIQATTMFSDEVILKDDHSKIESEGIELRKHSRIPVKWRIEISNDGKNYISAQSENISCSGLAAVLQKPLKANQKAHIKVSGLIRGRPFIFDAIIIVRHVSLSGSDFRCGCEFLKIKPEVVSVIASLVDERLKSNQSLQVA